MNDLHDNYCALASAIILQAMQDYKKALRAIRDGKKDCRHRKRKQECECFFLSAYGQMLSLNNGEKIILKCKDEVDEDIKKEVGKWLK